MLLGHHGAEPGGHLGQRSIADVVTVLVVGLLEALEIHVQQGRRVSGAVVGLQPFLQVSQDLGPVGQTREGIMAGPLGQRLRALGQVTHLLGVPPCVGRQSGKGLQGPPIVGHGGGRRLVHPGSQHEPAAGLDGDGRGHDGSAAGDVEPLRVLLVLLHGSHHGAPGVHGRVAHQRGVHGRALAPT